MSTDEWYIEQVVDNPFINDKAKTTYKYAINAIKRICNNKSIHDILTTPTAYGPKLLSSNIPEHSRKTYLTTILTFLRTSGLKANNKELFLQWYRYYMQISEAIAERERNNIPTERQVANNIDWEKVLRVRDTLPIGTIPHVLLSIYTYVPPRRQMDYMAFRVYADPHATPVLNHNHFHLFSKKYNSPYMFINKFKNAKHFKAFFNKEIPPQLVKTIKLSLKNSPRDHLFVQENGEIFTAVNSFTQYSNRILKRIFDKPGMTVNVLRHSFATYANSLPNITVGERQRNAIKMGHSLRKTLEYSLKKSDPPLSMLQNKPSKRSPEQEECYKKNPVSKKLIKIPCPK